MADPAPPSTASPASTPERTFEFPASAGATSAPTDRQTDEPGPEQEPFAPSRPAASTSPGATDSINLNTASFEDLREADLSVTQATRILAYRERFGGYREVEDLEKVPGFPSDLVAGLRDRLTV